MKSSREIPNPQVVLLWIVVPLVAVVLFAGAVLSNGAAKNTSVTTEAPTLVSSAGSYTDNPSSYELDPQHTHIVIGSGSDHHYGDAYLTMVNGLNHLRVAIGSKKLCDDDVNLAFNHGVLPMGVQDFKGAKLPLTLYVNDKGFADPGYSIG